MKNYGVIEGQRPTDYVAGVSSPIIYQARNPSGDWRPYKVTRENQFDNVADFMACVTFSGLSSIETQNLFLTGKELNFSDRFTAKMSGTTEEGNYLYKVGDSIRNDGLVLESDYPMTPNMTWAEYYASIPQALINKAVKYDIKYEFIHYTQADLLYHLKQSPIQVVTPGHARLGLYCEQDVLDLLDSYPPYDESVNYATITTAMKYVLTLTKPPMSEDEVTKQYVLAFYREPSADELAYWTGKDLGDFLSTAIKDRAAFLTAHE